MNCIHLERIIRAARQISDGAEIEVVGSQAIHPRNAKLLPIAFVSAEADMFLRNHPERADTIGAPSRFHETQEYILTQPIPTEKVPVSCPD